MDIDGSKRGKEGAVVGVRKLYFKVDVVQLTYVWYQKERL